MEQLSLQVFCCQRAVKPTPRWWPFARPSQGRQCIGRQRVQKGPGDHDGQQQSDVFAIPFAAGGGIRWCHDLVLAGGFCLVGLIPPLALFTGFLLPPLSGPVTSVRYHPASSRSRRRPLPYAHHFQINRHLRSFRSCRSRRGQSGP